MAAGTILSATIHDSTSGWNVDELVFVDQSGNITATIQVDSVDDSCGVGCGVILTYHIFDGGSGYTVADDVPNFPEPEGPECLINILAVESATPANTNTWN